MATVGQQLRAARHRHELRLEDVARKLRCSVPYLSDVERDNRTLKPTKLRRLATILRLNHPEMLDLFGAAGYLPPGVAEHLFRVPEAWSLDFERLIKTKVGLPRRIKPW